MESGFTINDIYDKNINFLFGSGASSGLFPTLSLAIKTDEQYETIETLASSFEASGDEKSKTALFMYYYQNCIEPVIQFKVASIKDDINKLNVIRNYTTFVSNILAVLQKKKDKEKYCNIFTTNYDGCFVQAADKLIRSGSEDFIINDGTQGFFTKYLEARNFNRLTVQAGIYNRHSVQIPQLNLINLHGSVYWQKNDDGIMVDYSSPRYAIEISETTKDKINEFSRLINTKGEDTVLLPKPDLTQEEIDNFWNRYKSFPIVNPTKWKFNETVFEEHYYQMLRFMSYELEKPNTVLISFGFSYADEHIRNLIKRSLANPSLQLFICCYDSKEKLRIHEWFKQFRNVRYIVAEEGEKLTFDYFNGKVLNVNSRQSLTEIEEGARD